MTEETLEADGYSFVALDTPAKPTADFMYTIVDNGVSITAYNGSAVNVVVPSEIESYPVTEIAASAFASNTNITRVEMQGGVQKNRIQSIFRVYLSDYGRASRRRDEH